MEKEEIVSFIRKVFADPGGFIPLHAPHFGGKEKIYLEDTIDSTFVSSVGPYVNRFESMMAEITGAKYAVATVNGTAALHLAMISAGVSAGDEVITQPVTFVATANAIRHAGADPVFVDVDRDSMGMSPDALAGFLERTAEIREGKCYNLETGSRIAACVPMHTLGFPLRIDEVADICNRYRITVLEDAAESLGSTYKGRHTGTFGRMGTFSFNGNKIVTCGGGGAVVTDDAELARKLKHLSTTAKVSHPWEFMHDEVGYNYRMPNLNAALACAQLEQLPGFLDNKRALMKTYGDFFEGTDITFVREIPGAWANGWLNTILFDSEAKKDAFLVYSNHSEVMTRPLWRLMHTLPMYSRCRTGCLENALWLEKRLVNLPSSVLTHNPGKPWLKQDL